MGGKFQDLIYIVIQASEHQYGILHSPTLTLMCNRTSSQAHESMLGDSGAPTPISGIYQSQHMNLMLEVPKKDINIYILGCPQFFSH